MNRVLILFVLVTTITAAAGQNVQKEIDEQVWKPFTKAIMNQDVKEFVSVHSSDLVRAERNSKRVLNLEEYRKNMETSWPGWKESIRKNKDTYVFELRFTERINNSNQAFEVGYFKNESTNANGEKKIYYGKFQVALRKENGIWKILVDSDSNEGGNITEQDFLAAKPIG
jgi:ketosteroid isomerase-like protein